MEYSQYKNFDDIINILPQFHTRIIINNWLKYVEPETFDMENLIINYENDIKNYDKDNILDSKDSKESKKSKYFPKYLIQSLYDFKIFIAINREEKNLIYLGWCPDIHLTKSKIVYILAGKVYNNTVYVYRIAQNPYYENILNINSLDFIKCLENIEYSQGKKFIFNYDNLHEYDNRYNISWNFYKN